MLLKTWHCFENSTERENNVSLGFDLFQEFSSINDRMVIVIIFSITHTTNIYYTNQNEMREFVLLPVVLRT